MTRSIPQPEENRMGTVPIPKLMISMGAPMMLSMFVQALYNIVDSLYVSHIPDTAAIVNDINDNHISFVAGFKDKVSFFTLTCSFSFFRSFHKEIQGIIHPAKIPFIIKTKTVVLHRCCHLGIISGILGDQHGSRMSLLQALRFNLASLSLSWDLDGNHC